MYYYLIIHSMNCALGISNGCKGQCEFHQFAARVGGGEPLPTIPLQEVKRMLSIHPPSMEHTQHAILKKTGSFTNATSSIVAVKTAPERLARFLRLVHHLGTAPWANMHFQTNYNVLMRLTGAYTCNNLGMQPITQTLILLLFPCFAQRRTSI